MLNTCSIGRRWKSREGWSRPVLTGERGTLSDPCGSGLVLWWFSRWMARNAVSCGHDDDAGKAFDLLASVVRFPDRHDRNRSCGWFRFCRPPVFRSAVSYWFCGGHGPGETPGPFPNPEAKAWHGDGTALERVWESSAPPHSHVGGSRRASAPGTPIFCLLCRPAGRSPSPGGRKAFPVPGRLGLFRASKGNFCCSTKTSGEQILFSERAFDTVYDTVF